MKEHEALWERRIMYVLAVGLIVLAAVVAQMIAFSGVGPNPSSDPRLMLGAMYAVQLVTVVLLAYTIRRVFSNSSAVDGT